MRSAQDGPAGPRDLRRRVEALEGLPLRPAAARRLLEPAEGGPADDADPALALAGLVGGAVDGWALVADRPWWPAVAAEALDRLWRHGVAASCAARRLAVEAGRPDPARWAAIALVHRLGWWAVAAVEPERLAAWLALPLSQRRATEKSALGQTAEALGRDLAERWGTDPALADAAWLHAGPGDLIGHAAADPEGLALVRRACAWAERTPWALDAAPPLALDPRARLLVAEVQVRCRDGFRAADAGPHEERLARAHARLLLRNAALERGIADRDRFLDALTSSDPADGPDAWADRAARAWCAGPGVNAATVELAAPPEANAAAEVVPLGRRARPSAHVRLRLDPAAPADGPHPTTRAAWGAWADLVADRDRLARRLEAAVAAHRGRAVEQANDLRREKLESLAEFAAGAGHELNNPLAVIQGRAQLLLARTVDADAARSLRAIVAQAQRAHRILRDLMYVARPPAPRPRPFQPAELLRACLRDLQAEADARGVRLVADLDAGPDWAWADPDPLRQVADALARNALEATPAGGTVRVDATGDENGLEWTVQDDGRGLDAREARHLFDPFFCGRQAGRGLGLGLPRAARAAALLGGELAWHPGPGRGTTFHLRLPLPAAPAAAALPGPAPAGEKLDRST